MYREPDRTPRCAVCESTDLTEPTQLDPSEGHLLVHFAVDATNRGWFHGDRERLAIDRARVCLQCGHVMLFFSAKRLGGLKAQLEHLKPIAEE